MLLNTIDPFKYNYFTKRLEVSSEILPLFENTHLTKAKNVRLLSTYADEPVVYTNENKTGVIHGSTFRPMASPKESMKMADLFVHFARPLFFDLMICEGDKMVVAMSRHCERSVNVSVLISGLGRGDAYDIMASPQTLLHGHKIVDGTSGDGKDVMASPQTLLHGHKIVDGTPVSKECVIGMHEDNRKQNRKQNHKQNHKQNGVIGMVKRLFRTTTADTTNCTISYGTKCNNDILIQRRERRSISFTDKDDVHAIVNSRHYYVEVQSDMKIVVVNDGKRKVFVHARLTADDVTVMASIERMSRMCIID